MDVFIIFYLSMESVGEDRVYGEELSPCHVVLSVFLGYSMQVAVFVLDAR